MAPYDGNPSTLTLSLGTGRQVVTDLRALRKLLSDPKVWARGNGFHDPENGHCLVTGAASVAGGIDDWPRRREIHSAIEAHTNKQSALAFNDSHTHPEVLALIDQAIAAELAKAGA